jgi:hypothetical protein
MVCGWNEILFGSRKNPKPRMREMLDAKRVAESHTSGARFVRCVFILQTLSIFVKSNLLLLQ